MIIIKWQGHIKEHLEEAREVKEVKRCDVVQWRINQKKLNL